MIKIFIAKVTHDNGSFKVKVVASCSAAAKKMICNMESCPDSAVSEPLIIAHI